MLLFGITVLAAVIIIGGASWTLFNNYNQSPPTQNPENNGPTPEPENQNPEATPSDTTSESPNDTITNPSPDTNDTLNPTSPLSYRLKTSKRRQWHSKTKYLNSTTNDQLKLTGEEQTAIKRNALFYA
jgi:cytoskeletal protein RodZ